MRRGKLRIDFFPSTRFGLSTLIAPVLHIEQILLGQTLINAAALKYRAPYRKGLPNEVGGGPRRRFVNADADRADSRVDDGLGQ